MAKQAFLPPMKGIFSGLFFIVTSDLIRGPGAHRCNGYRIKSGMTKEKMLANHRLRTIAAKHIILVCGQIRE
jgi:hypothetical protein